MAFFNLVRGLLPYVWSAPKRLILTIAAPLSPPWCLISVSSPIQYRCAAHTSGCALRPLNSIAGAGYLLQRHQP